MNSEKETELQTSEVALEQLDKVNDDHKYENNPFEELVPVSVSYDLKPEEVREGLRILQVEQIYKRNIIYTVILAVLFVVYLISYIYSPDGLGMIMMGLSAAVIVLIWMMTFHHRNAQAKAVSEVKELFTMNVFENGIEIPLEHDDYRVLFSEKGFRIHNLDDLFLLDLSRQRIYILPKRCMDEETLEKVTEYFKGNFVESKRTERKGD